MKKNLPIAVFLILIATTLSSFIISINRPFYSSIPPDNHTGAIGVYCTNCHGGSNLNSAGGSVSVTGLPIGSYTAGAAYNFSITTNHSLPNRMKWGFSVAARNSAGAVVGTFSTTNPNAVLNGNELSHNNAVTTAQQNSYTYNDLTWTAPSVPGPDDANITFYYVANAANGDFGSGGDFIYAGSISNVVLPVRLSYFDVTSIEKNKAQLKWRTESEQSTDYFSIQKSNDGQLFKEIATMPAAGTSTTSKQYIFTDNLVKATSLFAYYRIVTVDNDGRKTYSSVKYLSLPSDEIFVNLQSPNNVRAGNTAQFSIESNATQNVSIKVVALNGKQLLTNSVKVNKGRNIYKMEIPVVWGSGMVSIGFTVNNKVQQIPLLITGN